MKLRILSIFAVFGCATAALAQTVAWTVHHRYDIVLYRIDLTNGHMTKVGSLGTRYWLGDLAYDWTRNTLYAMDMYYGWLYTLDLATGQATAVGWTGITGRLNGLAFDPVTDQLFATDENGATWLVDRNTAAVTHLHQCEPLLRGLTYDPVRDTLVAVHRDGPFYTLDRHTGESSLLSNGSGHFGSGGILYSRDLNRVFGVTTNGELWSYDPNTFERTLVASGLGMVDGLAAVPEPASLIALGLSALALAARRRRR